MYGSKGLIVRNVRSCTSRLPKINFENWFLCHFLVARRGGRGGGVIHKLVQAQKICKMSANFFKKWFLKFLKQFGNLQIKPVQNMHRKGGTGKVRRGPAWCQVLFGRFGLVGLVWFGRFGLVGLVGQVCFGLFALVGLLQQVMFGRFCSVGFVGQVWFSRLGLFWYGMFGFECFVWVFQVGCHIFIKLP